MPQFPAQPSTSVSSNFVAGSKDKVALPIVAVWVKGRGLNNYMNTYALIDPGGTSGYCSEELAKKLGVPRKSYCILAICLRFIKATPQSQQILSTCKSQT